MLNLTELQHWFGRAVIRLQLDPRDLQEAVTDAGQLNAEQRLGIYAEGYRLRLLECMRAEYACLCAILGPALFDQFALGYLNARPSESHTLFDLGAGFPAFLRATRPAPEAGAAPLPAQLYMPEQLAELERCRVMSIRGLGTEQSRAESPDASQLLMQPGWCFELPDTSFVTAADFDFVPCVEAVEKGESVAFPMLKSQCLLVYRHAYRVRLMELQPWQAEFMHSCNGVEGWSEPCSQLSERLQMPAGELISRLVTWLPGLLGSGALTAALAD
ncbi:HvfC/BufC N-terminal domain-containing protein [Marinobacterium jannaschii]|uniref:HvfC/BufC N-terminal domain-containing protein n=1 Tax=Marinobacterium jannaschii TaxID=64970 RepID=UPI0006890DCE|nr:DNA-binding domain-containing protein [Marinobacterium jannaschii]